MPKVSVMIDAGKATAAAPLGPALGPTGVNIGKIVAEINEKTKSYVGMKIPVDIVIDSATKNFEIKIGSPPTSAIIKKEAKAEKGAANPKADKVGDLTLAQVKTIAEQKMPDMNSYKIKPAVKEVLGTCDSMGVYVEGKRAKEIEKEIEQGLHDSLFTS
ncbi:MAG: 50S ribosomal protein L11 [Candidatus Diapherotrites archaeon]|nr:50S ribosomal protein L11 [Candidatus Diapherotrites archaeon]